MAIVKHLDRATLPRVINVNLFTIVESNYSKHSIEAVRSPNAYLFQRSLSKYSHYSTPL